MREPLLKLDNIEVMYGGVKALDSTSIKVHEGEIVALMGPNGAGKSTVLKAIFGLAPVESGKVIWEGSEIRLKPYQTVELGISLVPQGKRVFSNLSVYENIEIGGHTIRSKSVLKERIEEILCFFPALKEKVRQRAGKLSGGQQQMVALARGLMTDPKLLLLDEPTLGLAPKIVKELFIKIKEINEKRGTAVMVVEHNIKSLLEITNRAYVLDKGRVTYEGEGQNLIKSDTLENVFMGKI